MPIGIYDHSHIVPWNKGKKGLVSVSEETRAKLRESRKGKKPGLGRKQSEVERQMRRVIALDIGSMPPSHKGVTRSPETRRRMSDAQKKYGYMQRAKGADAPNWKGGIANRNHVARTSKAFIEWRKKVFERDGWTCQKCNSRGVHLHPHHIKRFSEYLDLRFDLNNGITLCRECHLALHGLLPKNRTAQVQAT